MPKFYWWPELIGLALFGILVTAAALAFRYPVPFERLVFDMLFPAIGCAALLAAPAVILYRFLSSIREGMDDAERDWRRRHGRCLHCGYNVRATPHRCPECGTTPDLPSLRRERLHDNDAAKP